MMPMLDTQSTDAVFALLRQVNRDHGTAVLFVTHNPALAQRCDRLIEVVDGRVPQGAGPLAARPLAAEGRQAARG